MTALSTRVQSAQRPPANVVSMALHPRLVAELSKAGRKAAEWKSRRDDMIWLAHIDGGSLREIAAAVGLSNPGVLRVIRSRQDLEKLTGSGLIELRPGQKRMPDGSVRNVLSPEDE